MASSSLSTSAAAAGRILLASPVLVDALSKLFHFRVAAAMVAAHHTPHARLVAGVLLVIELVASLMILAGWRARVGAVIAMLYLIPVEWVFRAPSLVPVPELSGYSQALWRDLAVIGGLMLVAAHGPGKFSLRQ